MSITLRSGCAAFLLFTWVITPPARAADETEPTPAEVLARDAAAFRARLPDLSPQDAAAGWLALYDREGSLPPRMPTDEDALGYTQPGNEPIDKVLEALPPPAAWAALADAVGKRPRPQRSTRRDTGLRLLAAVLTGGTPAPQDLDALDGLPRRLPLSNEYRAQFDPELAAQHVEQVKDAFARARPGAEEILRRLDAQIARKTPQNSAVIRLPDVVALVGPERAADPILRALRSTAPVSVPSGGKTLAAARKMALEHVGTLRVPPWELVGPTAETVPLYEALAKRFPPIDPDARNGGRNLWSRILGSGKRLPSARVYDQYNRDKATDNYAVGLLLAGRTDDVAAVLRAPKQRDVADVVGMAGTVDALSRSGRDEAVFDVLDKLLAADPHLPLWPAYRAVAARLGRSDKMLGRARESAAREGLSEAERAAVRTELYKALLAADKPDEAADVIRDLIKAAPAKPGAEEDATRGRLGIELATLGRLLDDGDWVEEGLRVARGALAKIWEDAVADTHANHWSGLYESKRLANETTAMLLALGRGPEAVALIADGAARTQQLRDREMGAGHGFPAGVSDYERDEAREPLMQLVGVYHRAGKHADVLTLLDTLTEWGAKDLAEIYDEEDDDQTPLGLIAAAALADAGRMDDARRLLDPVLDAKPGLDPAYELLVKTNGASAGADATIRRLDALYARDRFEERPLIWKAHVLHLAGRNEEAEKVARQAIALDPSDGEQGRGRRMRVYAVLADILEAKDAKQAKFFRDVVQAIRVAEQADALYEAGLLSRGVAVYGDALKLFADAYCIQSRLAVQLAELGRTEEAAEHYRKAYELMPDSFGRVESHCFGCEGAFRGAAAQGIAERVFAKLVETQPLRPQVHYLMAYLRRNQGRDAEALPLLRTAVKLDPDYLNAWAKIVELADVLALPAAERDEAVLHVARLDPLRRHSSPELARVRNLKALWEAVEAAQPLRPVKPVALYPLKASAAEEEKQAAAAAHALKVAAENEGFVLNHERFIHHDSGIDDGDALPTPAEAVVGTNMVQLVKRVITGDAVPVAESGE